MIGNCKVLVLSSEGFGSEGCSLFRHRELASQLIQKPQRLREPIVGQVSDSLQLKSSSAPYSVTLGKLSVSVSVSWDIILAKREVHTYLQ